MFFINSGISKLKAISLPLFALVLTGCPVPGPHPYRQICVDFEPPLAVGTPYGAPAGNHSGDVVFTTSGIKVSVYDFKFLGPGGAFNAARIETPPASFGSGQCLSVNNINLEFDFSGIGFPTSQVQFEFRDMGGFENISVNGSTIFVGELTAAPTPIGGVSLTATKTPVAGGQQGIVVLTGVVKQLRVGGQELLLDNICAKR